MRKLLVFCIASFVTGSCFAQTESQINSSVQELHKTMSNEELYQAGEAERESIAQEAAGYANLGGRDLPENAFANPTPDGLMKPSAYAKMRAKNAAFISNIEYWRNQLTSNYANLQDDLKVNDLQTSRTLLGYMKQDSASLDNELAAVNSNNAKARHWPKQLSNEQLYQAGAQERADIAAQAAVYADLGNRAVPVNALKTAGPQFADLSDKNDEFIGNIEYWRNQLTANYANLQEDLKVNDLETARTLLNYMKQDSASLDNEIAAVQANNRKAK